MQDRTNQQDLDECRRQFEEWFESKYHKKPKLWHGTGIFGDTCYEAGWQAAWKPTLSVSALVELIHQRTIDWPNHEYGEGFYKYLANSIHDAMGGFPETCVWKETDPNGIESDSWCGTCEIMWYLPDHTEFTLKDCGMNFCPKCGGKIIEVPYPVEVEEDDD